MLGVATAVWAAAQAIAVGFYNGRVEDYKSIKAFSLTVDSVKADDGKVHQRCTVTNESFSASFPAFDLDVAYPTKSGADVPGVVAVDSVTTPLGVDYKSASGFGGGGGIRLSIAAGLAPEQRVSVSSATPVPGEFDYACLLRHGELRRVQDVQPPIGWSLLGRTVRHLPLLLWALTVAVGLLGAWIGLGGTDRAPENDPSSGRQP
ncbi:MAG: hypothetical protein ACM3SX_23740 [Deltaproteobacteria bacterium]